MWAAVQDGLGKVDILVNNAGVFGSGAAQSIEEVTLEEWRFIQAVNLEGVFLGCKTVALHCARAGYRIRCNSIHPGMVPTPLGKDVLVHSWGDLETGIAKRTEQVPLGELGAPEDIAWAALYLASDESRHVTGLELIIDGGTTL